MKDTEALQLYYVIVASTPAEASELGPEFWCEATRHLDYTDARRAIGKLLQTQTFISAADLNKEVKSIRAERCRLAPAYVPSSNELTQAEELKEFRNYWRSVADGNAPNQIDLTQLPRRPQLSVLTKGINT